MNLKKQINIKELIKGFTIIALYFFLGDLLSIPFLFLFKKNILNQELANLFLYVSLTLIFIIIYFKDLKKDFKNFIKNPKSILKIGINYWIKGLFIMMVSSFIFNIIGIGTSVNQEQNIELLKKMPLYELISAILLAPILEELVFRRGLKNAFKNNYLYAYTVGLIFGFIHITTSLSSPIMILLIIPYSAMGVAFGFAYKKTNNIFSTITIHMLHNAISLGLAMLGGI